MNKDSYIYFALSSLTGRNKAIVRDELSAHLDDLTERFIEMGYTPEQAEQKAVEKMGNAQSVGAQLKKVHSTKTIVSTCFTLLLIYIVYVSFLCYTVLAWGSEVNTFTIWVEFSFLFLSAVTLLISNRLKSSFPALISFIFTVLFFAGKFILSGFNSPLLYGVYLLFSGNIDDFIIISQLQNALMSNTLPVFTIVFYLLWGLFYAFFLANISKYNLMKYSKKNVRFESWFKAVIISALVFFTVVSVLLFAFGEFDDSQGYFKEENDSYYDGVCILESDEICDIEECYYNYDAPPQLLYKDYDWDDKNCRAEGYRLWKYDCERTGRTYNDTVIYAYYTFTSHYVNSKKYVAVIPVCFDIDTNSDDFREYSTPCFDNVQWVDTEAVNEITGSLNAESDPVPTDGYSIELHNPSAMTDDELVMYCTDVLEQILSGYYRISEQEMANIEGATNSTYLGNESNAEPYIYHFKMNERMEFYIYSPGVTVKYYKGDKCIFEHTFA